MSWEREILRDEAVTLTVQTHGTCKIEEVHPQASTRSKFTAETSWLLLNIRIGQFGVMEGNAFITFGYKMLSTESLLLLRISNQ